MHLQIAKEVGKRCGRNLRITGGFGLEWTPKPVWFQPPAMGTARAGAPTAPLMRTGDEQICSVFGRGLVHVKLSGIARVCDIQSNCSAGWNWWLWYRLVIGYSVQIFRDVVLFEGIIVLLNVSKWEVGGEERILSSMLFLLLLTLFGSI